MLRIAGLAWLLMMGVGCSRGFSAPAAPKATEGKAPGQPCDAGAECGSAICAEHVCCGSACTAAESCAQAGHLGVCTGRPLGAGCDAGAECPSGFCADGVCCATACDGFCDACNLDGGAGACQQVPDDEDPRRVCPSCEGCFSGVCGPAFSETDPGGKCGASNTCDPDGDCRGQDGQPCASDADCASGTCYGDRCLDVTYQRIDSYPFQTIDLARRPKAVAVGPRGDVAILVVSDVADFHGTSSGYGSLVAVLAPSTRGPWTTVQLNPVVGAGDIAAVTFVGQVAHFAVANGDVFGAVTDADGVYVEALELGSTASSVVTIDPGRQDIQQVAIAADADGQLLLAYLDGAGTTLPGALHTAVKPSSGPWSAPQTSVPSVATMAAGSVGQRATLLYVTPDAKLHARTADGQEAPPLALDPTCASARALYAATVQRGTADALSFVMICTGDVPYVGQYDPSASPPWVVQAIPQALPDSGHGLDEIDVMLPVGGVGGTAYFQVLGYNAFAQTLGDPFAATLWRHADGGFGYGPLLFDDVTDSYFYLGAASGPQGAPVIAYDSRHVDYSGNQPFTDSATLVIQSFHE